MRRRRAERCIHRAEEALAAGSLPEAVEALDEARRLAPGDTPDLDALRTRAASVPAASVPLADPQLTSSSADSGRRLAAPPLATIAAAVAIACVVLAVFSLSRSTSGSPEGPRSTALTPVTPAPVADPPAVVPSTHLAAGAPPSSPAGAPATSLAGSATHEETSPSEPPATVQQRDSTDRRGEAPVRAAYTPPPPPPPVGTVGTEGLPNVVGSGVPVDLSAPQPAPREPVEVPAVPVSRAAAGPPVTAMYGAGADTRPPAAPPAPPEPVEPRIRAVLSSYEAGFDALDASAVHRVWPGVDRPALARAFDGLASQSVSLGRCAISVRGEAATAQCTGSATWEPKVGGGSRTEARRWEFALQSAGAEWEIVRAVVR
jgi:hypothetical protein